MDQTQPEFEAHVKGIRAMWHKVDNALKDFERRAKKDPMNCAEEALKKVAYECNLYRVAHQLLFGLDLERKEEWWGRAPLPSDPTARALFWDFVLLYRLFDGVREIYRDWIERRIKRLASRGESLEDLARAICEVYVECKLVEPYLLTASTEIVVKQLPEGARAESLAEQLTGYFLTQLSTTPRYRLGRALREESGPPENVLLKELPAQALVAWDERKQELSQINTLKSLRNPIAENIVRRVSGTSRKRGRPEDLAALANFADKEQVLQLARKAGLAPREYEIFKLMIENPGIKYREVATKLGISVGTVAKTKWRIAQALDQAG